jgi:hypothetical protein
MYRFRQRRISFGFLPSVGAPGDVDLGGRAAAHPCRCDGVQRPIQGAIPAPLSRYRTVRPLLAGSGLTPPRAAKGASLRHRPAWENDRWPGRR